jgi:hypothetical protein
VIWCFKGSHKKGGWTVVNILRFLIIYSSLPFRCELVVKKKVRVLGLLQQTGNTAICSINLREMQSSAPPRPCFCSPHVGLYTPNRARELYTCSSDAQDVVINGSFISSIDGTNPSSDDGAPTGPVSISSVTHQPTNVYAKSTHAPCLSSMDPFAGVWDEREGYTQYSMERSRVAEIQEMINVVQREKETLQRTASNCGMGVREELQKLSNLLTNAEGRLVVAKQHLAEHGANTNMDTDVKSTPEHYSHSKDTQKYVDSWAEWDMQSCSSSDVAMGGDCDVVIDDAVRVGSDFSGANTKTACSSTSASSLPLSIGFHAGAESNSQLAEDGQLHAGAAACIGAHLLYWYKSTCALVQKYKY